MNKILLIMICVLLSFGCISTVNAALVTFDFNSLAEDATSADIASYMTGIYGSDIIVAGAREGDGLVALGPDRYIENLFLSQGEHGFLIHFGSVPITSVSFDWAKALDSFHAEAFYVEGSNTTFFSSIFGDPTSGNLPTYNFSLPVNTLYFHDSTIGRVGIDNLVVNAIPEPASMMLFGIGLVSLAALRRKRKIA